MASKRAVSAKIGLFMSYLFARGRSSRRPDPTLVGSRRVAVQAAVFEVGALVAREQSHHSRPQP
jgi:hypothetical protein